MFGDELIPSFAVCPFLHGWNSLYGRRTRRTNRLNSRSSMMYLFLFLLSLVYLLNYMYSYAIFVTRFPFDRYSIPPGVVHLYRAISSCCKRWLGSHLFVATTTTTEVLRSDSLFRTTTIVIMIMTTSNCGDETNL